MQIRIHELFYISNILSLLRLVAAPIPVYAIIKGDNNLALALVLIGVLSDLADGYVARRLNQVTELGKLLDPVADKAAIGALVVALWLFRAFPLWAAVLIIGRDLLILLGGLILLKRDHQVPSSNMFGKLTALAWSLLVLSYLTPFSSIQKILLVTAPLMVPISMWLYFYRPDNKEQIQP